MRRCFVPQLLAFVILAMLARPVFAQAPAGPPAPKVTITGTFDQITAAGRNFYDGNFSRDNDREWYARTRFRPDFEFAVGRTKAVLGIEIDLNYGQTGSNDGGFPGNGTGQACGFSGGCKGAGSAGGGLDINTDVAGLFEIKWIYTEFDLTGKDSLMPFIPILTVARAGGQPFATIANYKVYYANGDFAGVDLYSTFTPDIKNHFAWVDVEDQLAGGNRALPALRTNRGKDFAFIESLEITPFKGLDVKPMYSYFHADGTTAGAARRNATNIRTVGGTLPGGFGGSMNSGFATGGQTNTPPGGRPWAPPRPATRRIMKTGTPSVSTRAGAWAPSAWIPRSPISGVSTTPRRSEPTERSGRSGATPRPGSSTSSAASSWARCSSRAALCTAPVTRPGTTWP